MPDSALTSGSRPVVLIAEALSEAAVAELGDGYEIRHVDGTDRGSLLDALQDAEAVLVRSATQLDSEAFSAAPRLKVVARAGVGLDNVDIDAATAAGVMVVNAPTSNITSAAELAVGLILAVARHIPAADASLRAGRWDRSSFTGVELAGKVAGIVGLGRIGTLVAARLAAFGMEIVAHDPFVQPGRAATAGARLVPLPELLESADVITVHLPKVPETVGLIGEAELHTVKPSAIVINAARGGIVDEQALDRALADGRVAGAGVDVYASEPCTDSPLFRHATVVATPHLGASTAEAQEKAGLQVARSVKLALAGELVPDAVNVAGGVIAEVLRPGIPLTENLGRLFTAMAGEVAQQLVVTVAGEIVGGDVSVLELAALKGVFSDVVAEQVTYVNAPVLASARGLDVSLVTETDSPDWRNLIRLSGTMGDGRVLSVAGTLAGIRQVQKVVEVDGFGIDVDLSAHMLVMHYQDRPGVVGVVGRHLGDAGVNIAAMQVSRKDRGGNAVCVLTVDTRVPPEVLEPLRAATAAERVYAVDLDG